MLRLLAPLLPFAAPTAEAAMTARTTQYAAMATSILAAELMSCQSARNSPVAAAESQLRNLLALRWSSQMYIFQDVPTQRIAGRGSLESSGTFNFLNIRSNFTSATYWSLLSHSRPEPC